MGVKYDISFLCDLAGVSRAGYYKWRANKGNPNYRQIQRQELLKLAADIHRRFPTFGYRFVTDRIKRETGWVVCPKRILSVMQELDIKSVVRRRKYAFPGKEHEIYPNLLDRNFKANRPLQKVVTDVTYLYVKGTPMYLSAFIDLYNNEILDYELGWQNSMSIVIPPLKRLLEKHKKDVYQNPLTLHSDQGNQYTSLSYAGHLKRYNVSISMSRSGTPLDNAACESFWGWFKGELCHMYRWGSVEELRLAVDSHVAFYNNQRPQSRLNYMAPTEFRRCHIK